MEEVTGEIRVFSGIWTGDRKVKKQVEAVVRVASSQEARQAAGELEGAGRLACACGGLCWLELPASGDTDTPHSFQFCGLGCQKPPGKGRLGTARVGRPPAFPLGAVPLARPHTAYQALPCPPEPTGTPQASSGTHVLTPARKETGETSGELTK